MEHSERTFISIDGRQIEYQWLEGSREDAPTLVFLHEGLGCVALWRDFPAQVAEATGCSVLVYSRFGYGHSAPCPLPRPIDYMHTEALHILPKVLSQLKIGEHILIGHSDGASIALIYAGELLSPLLRGIITEAAHVFNEDICVSSIEQARTAYQETNLREKLAKYHRHVDVAFWGWNDVWLHPEFRHWNIEPYLATIRVPLLVIQGEDDQYGTAAQVKAIVEQAGSKADAVLLPDCQHTPHRQQQEATLDLMSRFIKRLLDVG